MVNKLHQKRVIVPTLFRPLTLLNLATYVICQEEVCRCLDGHIPTTATVGRASCTVTVSFHGPTAHHVDEDDAIQSASER